MRKIFFSLLSLGMLLRAESMDSSLGDIDTLLERYKIASDYSNITKSESAGFVDVFTRDDLEKMQARTLADVLKFFTVPFLSRSNINSTLFIKPSQMQVPSSGIRIFVNDHDITATIYKSGSMICNSITLDAIDHIEVYRSSSSVEFGNEPSTVIIKLYTKDARRDEGKKLRVSIDNYGSSYISSYFAQNISEDIDIFIFGNINGVNRDTYYNKGYALKSDSSNRNFYTNLNYKNWSFEVGHFRSDSDAFLGLGKSATPENANADTKYSYLHITNKLESGLRIQAAFDFSTSNGYMQDGSGIYAGGFGFVGSYKLNSKDKILSLIVDKTFKTDKNSLFLGGFIKHKKADVEGSFDLKSIDFSTYYNLYSLYAENKYSIDPTTMLLASIKGDFYRYNSKVEDKNEYILRFGTIKNIKNFQLKAFYTRTYYASPLIALYSDETNVPFKTNYSLKFAQPTLYSIGLRYKTNEHIFNIRTSYIELRNPIGYDPQKGFFNGKKKSYTQYEASYTYKLNLYNKFSIDAYYGKRDDSLEFSSPYGGHLIAFNRYKKFDFFNMLEYRAPYTNYGVKVKSSYDLTTSVRYHINEDLLVGLKGENILNKGYKQAYNGLDFPVSVFDRKFWLNVEYLF